MRFSLDTIHFDVETYINPFIESDFIVMLASVSIDRGWCGVGFDVNQWNTNESIIFPLANEIVSLDTIHFDVKTYILTHPLRGMIAYDTTIL